jgi:Zn ribbon nucleic-acid-binding protein
MGSVSSYENCPNCKTKESLFVDFYYKSSEEYSSCNECGYHHSLCWERDNEGKLKRKDENGDFSFSNLVPEEKILKNPFGAYRIEFKDGSAQCGSLVNKQDEKEFLKYADSIDMGETPVKDIVISRLLNGQIVKKSILNKNK